MQVGKVDSGEDDPFWCAYHHEDPSCRSSPEQWREAILQILLLVGILLLVYVGHRVDRGQAKSGNRAFNYFSSLEKLG